MDFKNITQEDLISKNSFVTLQKMREHKRMMLRAK